MSAALRICAHAALPAYIWFLTKPLLVIGSDSSESNHVAFLGVLRIHSLLVSCMQDY